MIVGYNIKDFNASFEFRICLSVSEQEEYGEDVKQKITDELLSLKLPFRVHVTISCVETDKELTERIKSEFAAASSINRIIYVSDEWSVRSRYFEDE